VGAAVAVAIGALKLLHRDDVAQVLERWIYTLQLDPNNQYIHKSLTKVWSVDDRTLKEISAGTFSYAGLFLIEGAISETLGVVFHDHRDGVISSF